MRVYKKKNMADDGGSGMLIIGVGALCMCVASSLSLSIGVWYGYDKGTFCKSLEWGKDCEYHIREETANTTTTDSSSTSWVVPASDAAWGQLKIGEHCLSVPEGTGSWIQGPSFNPSGVAWGIGNTASLVQATTCATDKDSDAYRRGLWLYKLGPEGTSNNHVVSKWVGNGEGCLSISSDNKVWIDKCSHEDVGNTKGHFWTYDSTTKKLASERHTKKELAVSKNKKGKIVVGLKAVKKGSSVTFVT
jgi:hypothetical protein